MSKKGTKDKKKHYGIDGRIQITVGHLEHDENWVQRSFLGWVLTVIRRWAKGKGLRLVERSPFVK